MSPESEKLHEEILEWCEEFLEGYYKKEDAPVEFIDRGIKILQQYQRMLLRGTRNGFIAKRLGRPLTSAEERFVQLIRMWEQDTPNSSENEQHR